MIMKCMQEHTCYSDNVINDIVLRRACILRNTNLNLTLCFCIQKQLTTESILKILHHLNELLRYGKDGKLFPTIKPIPISAWSMHNVLIK